MGNQSEKPPFVAKTEDGQVLWWLAAGFVVPVILSAGALTAGVEKSTGLAVLLALVVPALAASLWVVFSKDALRGQLSISADAIVLKRPFGKTRRLKRPVASAQYIAWQDDDALGIGIRGFVGMTVVLSGAGDNIRIGGKGVHHVPGIEPNRRQFHTAPGAALHKGDFKHVLAILNEDGAKSPQQSI